MRDPLEQLLVETDGIFIVQADSLGPTSWYHSREKAWAEAEKQALRLLKPVYVFRSIGRVEIVDEPVQRIEYDE